MQPADVHGVEANIEGLREAFEKTGGSMRDLLIPTFDELSRRFEAPPADSYIVAMDTLQNAFFLTQSAVGDLFLPVIVEAAQGLSNFLETVRAGIKDVSLLPETYPRHRCRCGKTCMRVCFQLHQRSKAVSVPKSESYFRHSLRCWAACWNWQARLLTCYHPPIKS